MKILKNLCLTFFFILAITSNFNAQEAISEEKRKLIGELIVLTKADKQAAEMMNLMLASFENSFQQSVKSTIEKTEMSQAEKSALEQRVTADQGKFIAKFRERFHKEISIKKYLEETMYPIYGKTFSESELADIVAFYKSATGQKMIEKTPEMLKESFRLAEEKFVPQVRKLSEEILEEQLKDYKNAPSANF